MSVILNLIFAATGPKVLNRFRGACKEPEKTQRELLVEILRTNQETVFGKEHGFGNIKTFEDFQRQVPISTYEDLSPYIDASLNGEPAQLSSASPILFATTSGTTGKSKFIPVTSLSRTAKSTLMRVWLMAMHRDHSVFSHKVLTLVSPEVESYAPSGIPCGAESGHGYKNMPATLKALYCCPYEVFQIKDYDAKYYTILRFAASMPISLIYTCNPSTVLLLAQRMSDFTESIIRDVRDGTLKSDLNIDPQLRETIEVGLTPDPKRAAFLEKVAADDQGRLRPRNVWPQLKAIACWKGGSVGMYVDRFDEHFRVGLPVRDIGYFASEHRGSVPISDEGCDGVMAVPTNVYEFWPADQDCDPVGELLLRADQLEQGRQYFVYVTTIAGLYRYDMNDIIEVTGFYEKTPLIKFIQKGKGVVSFTGEKLYEAQVIAAVEETLSDVEGYFDFIAAIGEMRDDIPCYVFLVEFEQTPDLERARELVAGLDIALRTANIEYAAKRDSLRIGAPILNVVHAGEFARYRRRVVEAGKSDGQFKILRLTTDQSLLEEFKSAFEATYNEPHADNHEEEY